MRSKSYNKFIKPKRYMGCGESKPGSRSGGDAGDKVVALERGLALHTLGIADWQKILKEAAGDREITVRELGEAFKDYEFGKQLLAETETTAKRLVSHDCFQARGGDLDWLHLFTLGLLYCKGKSNEKIDALLLTYDTNGDGVLFTQSIKKIISDLVYTSAIIMPSIAHSLSFEEANEKTDESRDQFITDSNFEIFQNSVQVDRDRLKAAFAKEVNYLLDSPKLRAKFPVQLGATATPA